MSNPKSGRSPGLAAGALAALCLVPAGIARGDDLAIYPIVLKDHKFTPNEIHVPTGKPFYVLVTNANDSVDEFEMVIPAIERTLQPGQQGKVKIKPLGPGHFSFFSEFDPDNEKGVIISE